MSIDPFFRELRARHPDVDIVLLPPEAPEPQPDDATLAAQRFRAQAAMATVRAAYDELASGVPAPAVRVATWAPLEGRWHPEVRVTHRDLTDPTDLLRSVATRLEETGWEVRLTDTRLVARRDGLLATADPSPSSVIVVMAGQPVSVSAPAVRDQGGVW